MSSQAFTGWVRPQYAPSPTPSAGDVVLNVVLTGAVDGANRIFSVAMPFTDITLYLNGVRLVRGTDFTPIAAVGTPGYDRVRLTVPPDGGDIPDVLSADLVAA